MKKSLLILVLLIPFITACGNDNRLTCYEEINKGEYKQTLIIDYNKEKTQVKDASIEVVLDIKEMELKDLDCTKETLEECLEEVEARFNAECENNLENCKVKDKTKTGFTFTADVKKDRFEDYFADLSTTLPINQMRSKIETKFGFTCE